ncbi:MAG: peptide-methionine (S)-S-oxide reductase MsrA [Pseudomonadota bacterium]
MRGLILTFCLLGIGTVSANTSTLPTAIFAGGCFWCMESDFEKLDGVVDVVSGFTGGTHPQPTYQGAHDGHYEAVLVTYDPDKIDYQGLLDHYWVNIDPFDDRGQFCDKGHEYRAAIFVGDDTESVAAEASKQAVAEEFSDQTVVTQILPRAEFFPIAGKESYHQDYYKNYSVRYQFYRYRCGRDARLAAIWGERVTH